MQSPPIQEFEAELEKHPNLNASFFTIPFNVQEVYGTKGQVKVKGTIKGQTFQGTLAPMGGNCHVLGLRKELRDKLDLNFGDLVQIRLEQDLEPREVMVPEDLASLLAENPQCLLAFDKLSYTHRREYVQWIEEAKKPETRQRRLEKTIEKLNGNG